MEHHLAINQNNQEQHVCHSGLDDHESAQLASSSQYDVDSTRVHERNVTQALWEDSSWQ